MSIDFAFTMRSSGILRAVATVEMPSIERKYNILRVRNYSDEIHSEGATFIGTVSTYTYHISTKPFRCRFSTLFSF